MMLTVETFEENGQLYVYIADENSTGCRYPIKSKAEVGAKVQQYINDNQVA